MIILAIETATIDVGVALLEDDRVLGSSSVRTTRQHGAQLHPAIADLMASCRVTFPSIGAIAIDAGPGLFTGLRVGIAAAKAFGMALGVSVVPVRSTEALRLSARELGAHVVPVVDMRRGECAWELFAESGLRLSTPDVLARELSEVTNDCVLVGDGALRYQGVFARAGSPRVCFGGAEFAAPSPRAVGAIGWAGLQSGGGLPAVEVEAIYLRAPDAKVNFETRENESADDATRGSSSRGTT